MQFLSRISVGNIADSSSRTLMNMAAIHAYLEGSTQGTIMETHKTIPRRLYKYQKFNVRTLDMLVRDNLHYSNPSTFNDPLDTKPSLAADLVNGELEGIVLALVQERTCAEMTAASMTMKVKGAMTTDHIRRRSRYEAEWVIAEIEYNAQNSDYDLQEHKRSLLRYRIELELLQRYGKGIVALAERADCSLMWSHYGDQHGGICIGYSVPTDTAGNVHKIKYGGSRQVNTSMVAAMLAGSDDARVQVDEAVFLRKAESWSYEQEWRLVGSRGLQNSPLELEEVVFGLKCEAVEKYIAMKALEDRERPVEFYEIREEFATFNLRKHALSYDDQMFVHFPTRQLSILECFEPLPAEASNNGN